VKNAAPNALQSSVLNARRNCVTTVTSSSIGVVKGSHIKDITVASAETSLAVFAQLVCFIYVILVPTFTSTLQLKKFRVQILWLFFGTQQKKLYQNKKPSNALKACPEATQTLSN
jgi:hypothetical protein